MLKPSVSNLNLRMKNIGDRQWVIGDVGLVTYRLSLTENHPSLITHILL